MNSVSL